MNTDPTHDATVLTFYEVWEAGANHPLVIASDYESARAAMVAPDDELRRVRWARIEEVAS